MTGGKHWSAIVSSQPMTSRPDPHFASCAAQVGDVQIICSVLPWRSCGQDWPGDDLFAKQQLPLSTLGPCLSRGPTIWGGDWNQAFDGPEYVGTSAGRRLLTDVVDSAGLVVPTAALPSATQPHLSIDHIAVPAAWQITEAARLEAKTVDGRLSDHDGYVVEAVAR